MNMKVQKVEYVGNTWRIVDKDGKFVAIMKNENLAHLFAASPEMKDLLDSIFNRSCVYIQDDETCGYCRCDTPVESHKENCPIKKIRALLTELSRLKGELE